MNKTRFLFLFLILLPVPSFAQTNESYTPPPMFGTPVVTPQPIPTPTPSAQPVIQTPVIAPAKPSAAPVVTSHPIPIEPAPTSSTSAQMPVQNTSPIIPKPIEPPYVQQQNAPTPLQPQTNAPPATIAPPPAPTSPAPVEPAKPIAKSSTTKSVSAEDLLDHPVTATSSPNVIDPLMASQIAKSKMPKPKDGEVVDDTGVDPSKVRYPNQKSVTPVKPMAKPIVEDAPKKSEKPKTKSKAITTEQQKMPVVTTKNVEELSLAPMPNVKTSNAKEKSPSSSPKQSLTFASGVGDITPAHKTSLGSIVAGLKAKPSARAQILSYATPTNATGSTSARRVSLTRGLAIRTYLLSQGIDGGRLDVRALGDETGGKGTLDQADIVIME